MDDNILLYDIQSGDTLEKIGGKIGMTSDELKDFHNSHCDKMNRLWFNNLAGVRQIIIPKQYKSPSQLKTELERELPPSSITRDFYADTYLVKESFSGIIQNNLEIEYKVDVKFRDKKDNNFPFEIADIRTYDFLKNDSTPDDKMSSIALACMESISPISFTIPVQGRISGFFEFETLQQKFEGKRQDLEDFFIGDVYKTYLKRFSENLKKKDYALKLFTSSLLYQLLFPKMEWFHKTYNWTEQFYFLPNSIFLKCSMSANYNHEGTEIVETKLNGTIKDMFSLQEILRGQSFDNQNEELADGEIDLLYRTDKKTKRMLEAEASVTFRKDQEIFRKQTLKLTQNG
ncbi:LysM peptidoglycan-binding domain-containing protein [Epilithonimonas zeae]|uniref:LysM peptidoglycan-binding domain-containing protein n=1 Tax=Epilithonimonas zeae TaxID=1416779 RepID=UPI00200D3ED5|nr:LysM peptidoglycan-binding domain-containing protein [Epilithonimonas zeae]UQB69200.1 LysM peptidoglycan-binding domain-containing protein [Epilithonimonas zeae]